MKVDGSLGSLAQGVSQQAPTERRLGQHGAQVNMVADPVRGLSRRRGTIWKTELDLALSQANAAANLTDSGSFRSFDYTSGGRDFCVLYRSASRATGSDMPVVIVYDKTNHAFLTLERNVTDAVLDSLESGGVSAITAVGKYVFMAGNSITCAGTSTDVWGESTNQQKTVAWVRGGAYSRTFKATVTKADNTQVSFQYTTPSASYPGLLDSSAVSLWLPDTAGSSGGTGPTLASKTESIGNKAASSTFTLLYAGSNPSNIQLQSLQTYEVIASQDIVMVTNYGPLIKGVHYTVAAGVITFLLAVDAASVTYQYEVGGTSATTVYSTESTTESAYVREASGKGVAKLVYADWSPTSLTVTHGTGASGMTNVAPSLPANANEYYWEAGDGEVIFHAGMIGNPTVTIKYTHTKVLSNPNYSKQVADITNAYNTAVTKHIGDAAAAIQPQAIASKLKDAAVAAGLTGTTVVDATIVFSGIKDITVSDSGDATLFKGLANVAKGVDDLTDAHFVGKIVKISPTGGESWYMKATAKNPSITSGVTEVLWVECPGVTRTITTALVMGVADGSTFSIASSATLLNAILAGTHPTYGEAQAGDDDSSPMPHFVGRKISYLGVFQDRLLIGSDAVLRCSKVGDYLNFFRDSVLTVKADDAFEVLSQGSEDDTLRFSVLYNRDLIVFGKRQYAVSGRVPLTPTSANMPVMSSHQGADDAQPVAAGGLIFYAKRGQEAVSVHQIVPGPNADSPESYSTSTQLDDYLLGTPVDLQVVPKPNILLVRTSEYRNSLFLYSYLDTSERRLQDCWHRWDYHASLGHILGTSVIRDGILVFKLRQGNTATPTYKQWAVAELQPLDGQLGSLPYLDSLRPYSALAASTGSMHLGSTLSAAYDDSTDEFLLGTAALEDVALMVADLGHSTGLQAGKQFDSYWEPTNPGDRDQDGKAINAGRLVVTSLTVAFNASSGFRSVVTAFGSDTTYTFNGRILGDVNNVVGQVPVTRGRQTIPVGRETREYVHTIYALTWLPLNLTAVDWTGQLFHRPQRVG